MTESIHGVCPYCRKETDFRELDLSENMSNMFSFFGSAIAGGFKERAAAAATLISDFNDERSFPNYSCCSCERKVMQCSQCKEILPYAHSGTSHVCNLIKKSASLSGDQRVEQNVPPQDIIALLEKLASLHEKGILSEQEFLTKKAELLSKL